MVVLGFMVVEAIFVYSIVYIFPVCIMDCEEYVIVAIKNNPNPNLRLELFRAKMLMMAYSSNHNSTHLYTLDLWAILMVPQFNLSVME